MVDIYKKQNTNIQMLIMQCIGIIAVVLGHGGNNIPILAKAVFPYYSWHMPFFIFISGYFYDRDSTLCFYFIKKTKNLLFPAIVANFICGIFSMLILKWDIADYGRPISLKALFITPFFTGYQFYINVSLWFIFQLYLIQLICKIIDRMIKKNVDIILVTISFFIAMYCLYNAYYNTASMRESTYGVLLTRTGFLIFFFWLGYLYKTRIEAKISIFYSYKFAFIIFIMQTLAIYIFGLKIHYNTRDMNITGLTWYWLPFISSITAILFFSCISKELAKFLQDNKYVYLIGKNTKYVVYYHQFVFLLCSYFIAVLVKYNEFLSSTLNFSMESMRGSQYYSGGTIQIEIIVVILSIFLPIYICCSIKKIKNLWLRLSASVGLIIGIAGYLYIISNLLI